MPVDRFFLPEIPKQEMFSIEGPEAHHMIRVVRLREGDEIECIDGKGTLLQARISSVTKKDLQLEKLGIEQHEDNTRPLWLLQALPRLNRLDWIVEKATELGIHKLILFPGQRGERIQLSSNQEARIQQQLQAALKQSGRLFLPKLEFWNPISEWKHVKGTAFFGDLRKTAPKLAQHLPIAGKDPVQFVIGPESGLDNHEINTLENLGYIGVSLSNNILRTDTAPITALAILQHLM